MHPRELAPSRGVSSEVANRSASGQSTTSRASSTAPEPRNASRPFISRLRDQSTVSETDSKHGAHVLEEFSASAAASLHHYNNAHATPLDPQLNGSSPSKFQYPFHHSIQPHALYNDAPGRPDSRQNQMRARTGTPQLGGNGTDVEKDKKKMASTTAANEKELRDMLDKNKGRDLESIGKEVRNAERSQKAERAKQLYAMRWLQTRCTQGKDSVPRNKVYTNYAQRCGNDRVDTLNPASFGKLVRIIFPGIQTRRLGQRGESKYHYVNLALIDEQQAAQSARPESAHGFGPHRADSVDDFDFRDSTRYPADSAAFLQHEPIIEQPQHITEGNPSSQGLVYAPTAWQEQTCDNSGSHMYSQRLKFSSSIEQTLADQPVTLPDIHHFLPPHTDPDLADALTALYRTHCTSLIDSMRFVREKSFFKLFSTFGGNLTVPVSKLFTNASIAPWIKLCDWHAYREIVRFVSQLDLQVIPPPVWNMITRVKDELVNHISTNYAHYPDHVLQAKIEPATVFSRLLERLLRVNETAHAAANLLMDDNNRNQMWCDWVRAVRPKRIAESELPACGHDQAADILTMEIRSLLEPLQPGFHPEEGTEFAAASFSGHVNGRAPTSDDAIERWAVFLRSIPGRFPSTRTRTLIHAVNAVGSAALRDITVAQAPSFGSWWITKAWADEMMLWMAEMGGFLETGPTVASPTMQQPYSADTMADSSRAPSRHSHESNSAGLGIDFNTMPNFAPIHDDRRDPTGPPTATFRYPAKFSGKSSSLNFDSREDVHDDSGIGMSLLSNDGFDYSLHHELTNGDVLVR